MFAGVVSGTDFWADAATAASAYCSAAELGATRGSVATDERGSHFRFHLEDVSGMEDSLE